MRPKRHGEGHSLKRSAERLAETANKSVWRLKRSVEGQDVYVPARCAEAVKSSANVTVCARAADQSRTCKPSGGDWSDGMIVFMDATPTAASGIVAVGSEDTVIHLEPALTGDNTLAAFGSLDNTAGSVQNTAFITYNPNGSTNWRGASLTLCDKRGPSMARTINIVITGDIRRGRTASDDSAPSDTFGLEATCPT